MGECLSGSGYYPTKRQLVLGLFVVVFFCVCIWGDVSASKVNILQKAIRIPPVWAWGGNASHDMALV